MRVMGIHVLRAAIVLLLPAVWAMLPATRATAQVDPLWDHYKAYVVPSIPMFEPVNVTLSDQFNQSNHTVGALVRFMNPVEKVHGPAVFAIHDSITHYSWRNLIPTYTFDISVAVTNQFGDQTLHLTGAPYVVGIAYKNQNGPAQGRNYYKAYSCQGPSVSVPVGMTDQFDAWQATVMTPQYFLVPATLQWFANVYPIADANQHYVCYEFQPFDPTTFTADVTDLWLPLFTTPLGPSTMICVPTAKVGVTPAHRDTWGKLKQLYR